MPTIPWMSAGKNSPSKNIAFGNVLIPGQTQVEKTYIRYGDFEFDAVVDLKFQVEPVYDSAGVLPKFYKHTFTVETVLTPASYLQNNLATDQPVDPLASQLRRMLAVPGRRLWIYSKGVGQNQRMSQMLGTDRLLVPDADVNQTDLDNPPAGHPNVFPEKTTQDPIATLGVGATLQLQGTPNAENNFFFKVEEGMDLAYGPRPVVQILEVIGSSRAMRLVWSVDVHLPICCVRYLEDPNDPTTGKFCLTPTFFDDTFQTPESVTEFSYSYAWDIDETGYTNLTISGSMEFAGRLFVDDNNTLNSPEGANIKDSGIFYHTRGIRMEVVRQAIINTFVLRHNLPGFIPSVAYNTSTDNKRLDFRITYKEVKGEVPYFKGIAACSVKVSVENLAPENLYEWGFGLRGSFTPFPGIPKDRALAAFIILVKSRLRTLQLGGLTFGKKDGKGNITPTNVTYLLQSIKFEEEIFTQRSDFDLRYRVICNLAQILKAAEMWKPINQNNDWNLWSSNIPADIKTLKGRSEVTPDSLTVVDEGTKDGGRDILGTCRSSYDFIQRNLPEREVKQKPSYVPEPATALFSPTECPPASQSYKDYRVWFELAESKPVVSHSPAAYVSESYYQDPAWSGSQIQANYMDNYFLNGTTPGQLSAATQLGPNNVAYPTLQGLGAGMLKLRMKGYALRYCGQVSPPMLVKVKTVRGEIQPVQLSSNSIINRTIFYGEQKLIFGAWDVTYAVPIPLDAGSHFVQNLLTEIEGEAYICKSFLNNMNSVNTSIGMSDGTV